jgi:hypothetical protein
MLTIPADCVQFPQVLYKIKSGSVHVDHQCKLASNWKVYPDLRFQKTSTVNALNVYIVLDADGSAAKECFDELQRQLVKCGLHSNNVVLAKKPSKTLSGWTKPKDDEPDKLIRMTEHEALIESLKEAKSNNVDLVLLIMSKPSLPRYTAFKRLADREHGLQSICITTKFAGDKGKLEGYMTNIAMKVNIKRGGINQRIEGLDLKGTMVLGADVIHPGPGSLPHCPSIAAMVGSVDDWGCKCLGSMRLQQRDRADREVRPYMRPASSVTKPLRSSTMWKGWSLKDSWTTTMKGVGSLYPNKSYTIATASPKDNTIKLGTTKFNRLETPSRRQRISAKNPGIWSKSAQLLV